jgi:acetyltransferase EpsM
MRDLIVVGGGGHARVVIEAALSTQWHILGFVDPAPCEETQSRLSVPWLGDDDALTRHPEAALVLGIGNVGVGDHRAKLASKIGGSPGRWATLIHRAACVSSTAKIGPGTVVLAGAVINSGARIGSHCIVNSNACVEHDATLGDFVHAGPGSVVAGGATVGGLTYLGMGALVRDHIALGYSCLVGMGAVVTKSFGDGAALVGIPAKAVVRYR